MSLIDLVCAADERFALPLAVTLRSAADCCSRSLRVFVLNAELSQKARGNIEKSCRGAKVPPQIIWVDTDRNYMRDVPRGLEHLSPAAYLRLTLGRLLPAEVKRAIYLDSDVLVVNDLVDLWETDLNGCVIGAVRDFLILAAGWRTGIQYCLTETGIDPTEPIFNSGVLLIDVDAYRKQDVENRCVAFLRRWRDQVRSADQDAINGVLHGQIKALDIRWNVQVAGRESFINSPEISEAQRRAAAAVEPAILHFVGAAKPWNSGLRSPFSRMYVKSVGRIAWFGPIGFRFWQIRRLMQCMLTIASNRMKSMQAQSQPRSSQGAA